MGRSIFGWSYPHGCSWPPDDYMPDPHPKSEELYALLEQAGVPQDIIDKACELIYSAADELEADRNRDCPACLAREAEEWKKYCEEAEEESQHKPRTDARGTAETLAGSNDS